MVRFDITTYTDEPRATGWTGHARSELPKRLRRAIQASPQEIREITRSVLSRQCVSIEHVRESEIHNLRIVLETLGATVEMTIV